MDELNLIDSDIEGFGDLFEVIYKGDLHATALSMGLLHIIHTWDDLIDKDHPVSDNAINQAFLFATTEVAGSPLWGPTMSRVMKGVYLRWQAANAIEKNPDSTDNELAKAWMLRVGFYDLFVLIAQQLHGTEWAVACSELTHSLYAEKLADFIKEVKHG